MVDIANDTSTGAELDLVNGEGTFSDLFESTGSDEDWIKVVVDQAGTYNVALTGGDGWGNFSIAMYDSKGVLFASDDDDDGFVTEYASFDLEAGGTYYLSVSTTGTDVGNLPYTVAMELVGNTAPTFSAEDTLTGVNAGVDAEFTLADLLGNAADADNDTLDISGSVLVTGAAGDDIVIGTANRVDDTFTITLNDANFDGDVYLAYTVTDGTATVAGSAVYHVNDIPINGGNVALTDTIEGASVTTTVTALLGNASDDDALSIEDGEITVTDGDGTIIGSASISGDDVTITLTDLNYNGEVNLDYIITDGEATVAGSASYNLSAVNDAPTNSGPVSLTDTIEGASVTTTVTALLANANDVDGDTLSILDNEITVTDGDGTIIGSASISGNDVTITLDDINYNGEVNLDYVITDAESNLDGAPMAGETVAGSASYNLSPVNDAPTNSGNVALTDTIEGASVTTTVTALLGNAEDVDAGDTLSIQDGEITVTDGEGDTIGSASISGDDVTITLNDLDYNGEVNLDYIITDGEATVAGSASYNLSAVDDAPTGAPNGTIDDGTEDTTQVILASTLLSGFTDVDSELAVTAISADHGTFEVTTGGWTFTPEDNYHGTVIVTYTVSDGTTDIENQTRSFSLASVNDGGPVLTGEPTDLGNPIANDSFAFTADDLLEGYTDVDNDELSITGAVTSDHGTVTDLGGGNYSFTPTEDYIGKVTFIYDVTDGHVTVDGALSTYVISDTSDLVTTYNPLTQGAVNTVTAGEQNSSSVAQLSGGGYVVTWTGTDLSGSTASVGIKAQRVDYCSELTQDSH